MTPTQPKFIDMPFAYNGARNEIPATAGSDDGSATLNDGFPTVTEQPVAQGGIPPRRKDFNGILYALSNFQFFAQAGGIYTYSEELDYRTPAMVWYGGNLYICIANNGVSSTVVTPGTNSSYWKDFIEFLGLGSAGSIVAQRLGTSTVGSGTKPIWLNSGSPTASNSTVGGTAQGMYLNAGTMTACSATVGSSTNGIYMDAGVFKACSGSSGGGSVTNYVVKSYSYTRSSNTAFTVNYTTANGDFAMPSGGKVALVGSDSNMGDTTITNTGQFSQTSAITISIRIDGVSAGSQTLRVTGSGTSRVELIFNGEMYIAYFNSYPYFHFAPADQTLESNIGGSD